jgi:hypothetical protein
MLRIVGTVELDNQIFIPVGGRNGLPGSEGRDGRERRSRPLSDSRRGRSTTDGELMLRPFGGDSPQFNGIQLTLRSGFVGGPLRPQSAACWNNTFLHIQYDSETNLDEDSEASIPQMTTTVSHSLVRPRRHWTACLVGRCLLRPRRGRSLHRGGPCLETAVSRMLFLLKWSLWRLKFRMI